MINTKKMNDILEDILLPKLRVVFCGTAASNKSAELKSYYAGPGNKFWKVLNQINLTPHLLLPQEYRELLNYSIGLTDIAKKVHGNDSEIKNSDYNTDEFRKKIETYQPKIICFNGKEAGKRFLNMKKVSYGLQNNKIIDSKLFIAPSTSGMAKKSWNIDYWHELSNLIKEKK